MASVPEIYNAPPQRNLIIVCVENHPKAIAMLRLARKRAQERNCVWRAVFVETPVQLRQGEEGARALRLLTMAQQMGGETAQIEAETAEKGIGQLLEKEAGRVALVIVGSTESEGWFRHFRTLPWMQVVRVASQYTQVEVLPLSGQYYRRLIDRLRLNTIKPHHFASALGAVALAYICAYMLKSSLPPALFRVNDQNIALLFMIACAFAAGRYGLLPGLVASLASFLTVNYYFTVPYHVLKIDSGTDLFNMALFLSAALLISLFTSQTRGFAQKAAKRELSTQALFTLYRVASNAFSSEQALEKLQQKLEHMLEVHVAFFLPSLSQHDQIEPAFPKDVTLSDADRRALDVCWSEIKTTGEASPFNPGTPWRFEPMISPSGEIGVLAIRPRGKMQLDAWFGWLLTAIADQTATILEHITLERSMQETRIREEREQLRSMLLSSISHDFKTPLAGIIGALSVYRSLGERLSAQKREELIDAAMEESQRLDSFITNILDMTRLESGTIRFKHEWHEMKPLLKNVTKRLQYRLRQHELVMHPCPIGVEASMDIIMTEQVLQNVIDNACKYTPPGTRIEISCLLDEERGVLCEVRDHGPGIPPEKLEHVFDKYARLHKQDSQVAGTGLGLCISKAVMEAQGGWITAANHPDGGAVFTLCLPSWRKNESDKQKAIL